MKSVNTVQVTEEMCKEKVLVHDIRKAGKKSVVAVGDVCNQFIADNPEYSKAELARISGMSATSMRKCTLFANFPLSVREMLENSVLTLKNGVELLRVYNTVFEPLSPEVADTIVSSGYTAAQAHTYIYALLKAKIKPTRKTGTKEGQKLASKAELAEVCDSLRYKREIRVVVKLKQHHDAELAVNSKGDFGASTYALACAYERFLKEIPEFSQSDLVRAMRQEGVKSDDHHVSTTLSLLLLPEEVQLMLMDNELSAVQGKSLALLVPDESVVDSAVRKAIMTDIVAEAKRSKLYKISGEALRVIVNYRKHPCSNIDGLSSVVRNNMEDAIRHWLYEGKKFTRDITFIVNEDESGNPLVLLSCAACDKDVFMAKLAGNERL